MFRCYCVVKTYKGSVIDLTICKKIIEMRHGNSQVASTTGAGSIFHFTLKKLLFPPEISGKWVYLWLWFKSGLSKKSELKSAQTLQ